LNFNGPFGLEKKLKSSSTAAPLSMLNNQITSNGEIRWT